MLSYLFFNGPKGPLYGRRLSALFKRKPSENHLFIRRHYLEALPLVSNDVPFSFLFVCGKIPFSRRNIFSLFGLLGSLRLSLDSGKKISFGSMSAWLLKKVLFRLLRHDSYDMLSYETAPGYS